MSGSVSQPMSIVPGNSHDKRRVHGPVPLEEHVEDEARHGRHDHHWQQEHDDEQAAPAELLQDEQRQGEPQRELDCHGKHGDEHGPPQR